MTFYNVHVYREMRLYFPAIEANTLDKAAAIAVNKPTVDADSIEDCDGETTAALVDVVGDEEFIHSWTIDFEAERRRKLAAALLPAVETLLTLSGDLDAAIDGVTDQFDDERATLLAACKIVQAAIGSLGEGISQPTNSTEEME